MCVWVFYVCGWVQCVVECGVDVCVECVGFCYVNVGVIGCYVCVYACK